MAPMDPGEVVGEYAVAGLGVVRLNADAEPRPEGADGHRGKAIVAVVERLCEEAGGHGEFSGRKELHLLVRVGEARGVDEVRSDVVAPAGEHVEGGRVDAGAGCGRWIVVVPGRTDVVHFLLHITTGEGVLVADVMVDSI